MIFINVSVLEGSRLEQTFFFVLLAKSETDSIIGPYISLFCLFHQFQQLVHILGDLYGTIVQYVILPIS